MTAALATLCNGYDNQVGRLEAAIVENELSIELVLDSTIGTSWQDHLAPITQGTVKFYLDSVLRFIPAGAPEQEAVPLDKAVRNLSECQLRLVYNPEGIEQGHQMKARLWSLTSVSSTSTNHGLPSMESALSRTCPTSANNL